MSPEEVLEQTAQCAFCPQPGASDIEFSPEDGYRSDPDFFVPRD